MSDTPNTMLGILEEVERVLRSGDSWLRGQVEGWRFDGPDIDDDGGEEIRFRDSKQLDRFVDNLGRAANAVEVVVEALRAAERESAR
jgi:hypothetical protein